MKQIFEDWHKAYVRHCRPDLMDSVLLFVEIHAKWQQDGSFDEPDAIAFRDGYHACMSDLVRLAKETELIKKVKKQADVIFGPVGNETKPTFTA